MSLFSDLLPVIGGVGGFLVGGPVGAAVGAGIGSQASTNVTNRELTKEANQASIALWREQSEYNSPTNQMLRLQKAGLSPQLAYGQIAESRAANPPPVHAARYEAPNTDFLSKLANYQQIKNDQALNAKLNIQLVTEKALAVKAVEDARYAKYENDVLIKEGILKSDSQLLRSFPRGWDYIKGGVRRLENYIGPSEKAYFNKSEGGR